MYSIFHLRVIIAIWLLSSVDGGQKTRVCSTQESSHGRPDSTIVCSKCCKMATSPTTGTNSTVIVTQRVSDCPHDTQTITVSERAHTTQATSWTSKTSLAIQGSLNPTEREDISHYTSIAILSSLVCVLGFTVAVLAVALYRTRRTKKTARLPLPPSPGPPATDLSMLTLTSHDYSTVYSQEQNRLTETHERYAPSGLNKTNRVPNRTKMRETVTIKEVQKTVDTATSSSEEHMYSVPEKKVDRVRSDCAYSIDKEGTYRVLEECIPEKKRDPTKDEGVYHVLEPEGASTDEDSTSTE